MQCHALKTPCRRLCVDRRSHVNAAAPTPTTPPLHARRCVVRATGSSGNNKPQVEEALRRRIAHEDELRDPANFVEYFLPRPLRLAFFGGSALSCAVGAALAAARLLAAATAADPLLVAGGDGGGGDAATATAAVDVAINAGGAAMFAALFFWDRAQAAARVERRRVVRQRQIAVGDREVYVNADGQTMSRLKEVDDEWILRRLERWGRRDGLPFVGPEKAALLAALARARGPRRAVEVGTMAGMSAIALGRALPPGSRLISLERAPLWALAAKRFVWQASQGAAKAAAAAAAADNKGQQQQQRHEPPLATKVDVWIGDATDPSKLKEAAAALAARTAADAGESSSSSGGGSSSSGGGGIDFLFLDGTPRETLAYLQAALPSLAPGAVVAADNAGVFAAGGMAPYLAAVRAPGSGWDTASLPCALEWRPDVPDAIEVSVWQGAPGEAAALVAEVLASVEGGQSQSSGSKEKNGSEPLAAAAAESGAGR